MMTATHCPYCALQCGMNLTNDKQTIEVQPRDFPTNNGGLCRKGWTSVELLSHPERLTTPLLREKKNAPLRRATWGEAIERIVSEMKRVQTRYGRDAVGVFGGGGLTNEKVYLLGKFARVALGTSQIDYNGRFCMSSAGAANIKAFGVDRGLPFPLEDIPGAETILLIGANCAETMPPIMQWFDKQKARGGKLIVADPRLTPTAEAAHLHLQITPGTDLALANGLLHICLHEKLIDEPFISSRTTGFDEVKRTVAAYWPDRVEHITGVPVQKLVEAARLLGNAKTAMILTARGAEQHAKGVDTVLAFINLALALGKVGKPHCGYGCLTGQGNGQGGREHGQKADQLPGYRKIENPEHREQIARIWGINADDLPRAGRSAYELLDSLGQENGVRALLVHGSNVAVSSPNAGHIQKRLASLDFLMVADIFLSETAEFADVVLPVAQWAEETGTMTNLEGRVILRQAAKTPPDGIKTDAQICALLAQKLGCGDKFPSEPRVIFEEFRRATAGASADYSGISYERIQSENGVFWPCSQNETSPNGTPRMFVERFATDDGKARFHAVRHRPAGEEPDDDFPLYFTTGRVMAQYQSGTQTRRIKALCDTASEAFVEMHPLLAKQFGIAAGDVVQVETRRGLATAPARLSQGIRRDTIFMPFHWGGGQCANLLTNPALDSTSKMPEFKVCAARIEKVEKP
jgi:assimilatory nitrate reductase catalytic subunit